MVQVIIGIIGLLIAAAGVYFPLAVDQEWPPFTPETLQVDSSNAPSVTPSPIDENLEPTPTPTIAPSPTATLEPTATLTPESTPIPMPVPSPTATHTPVPTDAPPPTSTPEPTATPTQEPTLVPTPTVVPQPDPNQIASDIPGTELSLGASQNSILDVNTKPRDVYAIELVAGQEVMFTVSGESAGISVVLANPGAESFSARQYTTAFAADYADAGWSQTFLPGVSGIYYLALTAYQTSQPYTVSIAVNQQ